MARRRKKREDEEPSYWLSYSDMMAGLLLMFVIIISFTMMQSKIKFEQDERELEAQRLQLASQQTTMSEQSTTLTEQEEQLAAQQATLDEQRKLLDDAEAALKEKEETVTTQQTQLAEAQSTLSAQQTQLETAQSTLTTKQTELEEAQAALTAQQQALSEAQAALTEQEATVAAQQNQLEIKTEELATAQSQIAAQQQQMADLVGVRKDLIEALREAFSGTATVSVDAKTGSIMFESSVLFPFNGEELSEEGRNFLREFLPQYFSILLSDQFRGYVSEIIIEGHTDDTGGYLYNLELSQKRALAVASFCLNDESGVLEPSVVAVLRDIVTANGRSYSDLITDADGRVNQEASRRVVFKFRLKDEEMVDEMIELLSGVNSGAADSTASAAE